MSLVGTRPPTVDEWDKYELHHRARLATKPGLTGMWQVSGRSNITDFEEVVKLDKQYISEWTMGLDIKILFKEWGSDKNGVIYREKRVLWLCSIPACDSFLLDTDKADELAKTLLDSYNEEFNKANLTKNVQGNDIDIENIQLQ